MRQNSGNEIRDCICDILWSLGPLSKKDIWKELVIHGFHGLTVEQVRYYLETDIGQYTISDFVGVFRGYPNHYYLHT